MYYEIFGSSYFVGVFKVIFFLLPGISSRNKSLISSTDGSVYSEDLEEYLQVVQA